MTLLVRNEEEVLEANLEYHLAQGVDFVIVTDHGSTDGTQDILRAYEQRGVARVIRVEGNEHHQSRRVTRMARLAYVEHGADWVINTDADEFWWPAAGSLSDLLAAVPGAFGQIIAPRHDFLPIPAGRGEAFYERLIVRARASKNLVGGPLEPKVAHRGHPSVVVAPGNHGINWLGFWPTPARVPLLEVFHFPMRSYDQFEAKCLATGRGYEALPFRSEEVGRDQLRLLNIYREGHLQEYFDERLLSDEALASGLKDGALVLDERLAGFMRAFAQRSEALKRLAAALNEAASQPTVVASDRQEPGS